MVKNLRHSIELKSLNQDEMQNIKILDKKTSIELKSHNNLSQTSFEKSDSKKLGKLIQVFDRVHLNGLIISLPIPIFRLFGSA